MRQIIELNNINTCQHNRARVPSCHTQRSSHHGETHALKIITTINVLDKGINIAMFDNSLLAAARLILSLFCSSYRRLWKHLHHIWFEEFIVYGSAIGIISCYTYALARFIFQCLHKWNLILRTWGQKLFNGEKRTFEKKKDQKRTRYRAFEDFKSLFP